MHHFPVQVAIIIGQNFIESLNFLVLQNIGYGNGKRLMYQGDEVSMVLGIAMLAFRNNSEQAKVLGQEINARIKKQMMMINKSFV